MGGDIGGDCNLLFSSCTRPAIGITTFPDSARVSQVCGLCIQVDEHAAHALERHPLADKVDNVELGARLHLAALMPGESRRSALRNAPTKRCERTCHGSWSCQGHQSMPVRKARAESGQAVSNHIISCGALARACPVLRAHACIPRA